MAGASDGSVVIKVRFDTSAVDAGVGDIKAGGKRAAAAAERTGKAMTRALSGSNYDKGAMEFMDVYEKALNGSAEAAKKVLGVFEQVGIGGGEAVKSMRAVAKEEDAAATAAKGIAQNAQVGNQAIVSMAQELERLKARQKELSAAGAGIGHVEYDNNAIRIQELTAALRTYQKENAAAAAAEKNLEDRVYEALVALQSQGVETVRQTSIWERLRAKLTGVAKQLVNTASASRKVQRNTKSLGNSLSGSLKTVLKYGLGIRSLYVLSNRLRNAITDGLSVLEEQDSQTKATLDGLKKSLNSVKLSLATAFAPVLTAVAPLLQKLCAMLVTAANYVAMFFAALSGKKTYKGVSGVGKAATANIANPGVRIAAVGQEGPQTDYAPGMRPMAATAQAVRPAPYPRPDTRP